MSKLKPTAELLKKNPNWSEEWESLIKGLFLIKNDHFKFRYYHFENKSFCYVMVFDGVSILLHLFTPEEHKEKGYATKLVKQVIKEEQEHNGSQLLLARTTAGIYVEKVFVKLGFVPANVYTKGTNVVYSYDLTQYV